MEEAHRFVKLNSTSTARAPFLIHSIVGLEVLLSIAHCALWPFLCIAVTRAGVMHRNFRIQICLATWYTVIGQIARLVSIFYQINDLPLEDSVMYICDLIKLTVIGYYCSLMGSFAIERYVATHYWRWYERGSLSTLLVLVGAETTMLIPNFVEGLLNLEEIITINSHFAVLAVLFVLSSVAFLRTYHVNVRLRSEFAQGARVGFYSVSRSFQVNENVVVMEYMFAIMVPHSPVILAAFAAFSFKMFGPRNWETSRDVAYALYDLLIIVFLFIHQLRALHCNPTIFREFAKIGIVQSSLLGRLRRRITSGKKSAEQDSIETTKTYFSQLTESWNR